MATNTFRTTQYVLDEVFVRFVNYLNFIKVANRNLEEDFKGLKYATGQTLNYRLEERYIAQEGATATSQSRTQVIRPLTINKQFNHMVDFSGMELTFDRARDKPYLDMMLNPRAKAIANKAELYVANTFQNKTYQAVGTPGVPIDFDTVTLADAYMTELGIPEDGNRFFANPPRMSSALSNELKDTFNMTVNTGALMDGFIGHLSGFDFFKTNFLTRQIAGAGQTGGSPPTGFKLAGTVTNGPISSGSTINVTGVASSTLVFREGDSIEIADAAGVYMINPLTYQPLQQRAQFVVTADVISTGVTAVIPVSPEIIVSGPRQNISAAIPNGAQLYLADDHNVAIAYHNQSVVFAAPPITELKGGVEVATTYSNLYKLALTYTLGSDVINYLQYDRLDMIAGLAVNAEFAVRIRS